MSTRNLEGKSVVVTGGGSGLGRAYVLELTSQGANVVINDIDGAAAQAVADEVRAIGVGAAVVLGGSVADWNVARDITTICVDSFGAIDGLVNNAGVLHNALPWEEDEAAVRRAVEVNVLGSMFCGIHALRRMVAQRHGAVVNIASGTLGGVSALTTYGTTKGAIASMVYGWSLEVEGTGVRVNGVMPMAVTGMTRIRDRWMSQNGPSAETLAARSGQGPERVAPLIAYLLSDRAQELNGAIIRHDGHRITLVTRPTWGGGYELGADDELGFDQMAAVVERLRIS